ncbi:MAG: DUF362 domain-containing protein [Anaerolineae bacterium]|nr:DUF362 domain-containing protein [Anaerolineae bacterium]
MTTIKAQSKKSNPLPPQILSRRAFLKIAATASILTACGQNPAGTPTEPQETVEVPTDTPESNESPQPTATRTLRPTATMIPTPTTDLPQKPELIKSYPATGKSKVIHTHHTGVWSGNELVPDAIRQMLDASITQLTGLNDAREAWKTLFKPTERIAIKVNAFRNSLIWTHMPLVMGVVDALQEAGIPAEQIVIYDYYTSELETANYPVNKDGAGVQCYGTDNDYSRDWRIADKSVSLSNVLLSCDALINMPVLKSHMLTGLSFALKNHYGTIQSPQNFHSGKSLNLGLPELNMLPPIRERTRLIIGDVLAACLHYKNAFPYWDADYTGDSILMSFDPVAHDTVGFQLFSDGLTADGGNPTAASRMSEAWFQNAAELGLGTNDLEKIDVVETQLT